ncbi:MAG TPA: prepilin-type N-terminal cleavage/methylation domain-containing protein [Cellulomonas sp.]
MQGEKDDGFGLIEIIVSMALLGLLAAALAPLFASSLALTAKSAVLAHANQLANSRIEELRASATCATAAGAPVTSTDSRGVGHTVTTTIDASTCATDGLLQVEVDVDTTSALFDSEPIVSVSTTIWVH